MKNAREDITINTLCRVAGVKRRLLFYMFRTHIGISPMQYLKCYRLRKIRHAIKENPKKSLLDIVVQWNIWHLGDFSRDYKKLFGELPSMTQKRMLVVN